MALPLATLLVPVPIGFVYLMEVLTGLWTLYIHTDLFPLPWPFMGCDYHYIHHRYNWRAHHARTPPLLAAAARGTRPPPPGTTLAS